MLVCASQIIKLPLEQCRAIFLSPSNYIYCQHPHDAAGAGEHDAKDGAVRQQPRVPGGGAHTELPGREAAVRGEGLYHVIHPTTVTTPGPATRAPAQVRGHELDSPAASLRPVL